MPASASPTTWVGEQAAAFVRHLAEVGQDPATTLLFRDRDGKYTPPFDANLRAAGVDVRQTPVKSPNMNAFIERWGQSLRVECLDRILALGETHFNFLVREYVEHYNQERPHPSLGNRPLPEADSPEPSVLPFPSEGIECRSRLGGLLKSYRRAA